MKRLAVILLMLSVVGLFLSGCGGGGGGGGTSSSQITPDSTAEADNLVKKAQSAVEENDATGFADLFENVSQTEAQNNFSRMTEEERAQLAQGLGKATPIYQSPDGNLRRYQFTVEIDGKPIEFPIDLRKDKNGNWRIANL